MQDEDALFTELGKRLVSFRKGKGLTQEQLAAKSGVDTVSIGYLEQGKRRPTVTTISRLAKAMDLSLEDFFKSL